VIDAADQGILEMKARTESLVSSMSCQNAEMRFTTDEICADEIQVEPQRVIPPRAPGRVTGARTGDELVVVERATRASMWAADGHQTVNVDGDDGLKAAIRMSMRDEEVRRAMQQEEDRVLQQAIAASLVDARVDSAGEVIIASHPEAVSNNAGDKDGFMEDLIDIGQHDLLDLADSLPASAPLTKAEAPLNQLDGPEAAELAPRTDLEGLFEVFNVPAAVEHVPPTNPGKHVDPFNFSAVGELLIDHNTWMQGPRSQPATSVAGFGGC